MDTQVTCPHCRSHFQIDQIMSAQMADSIRAELQAEFAKKAEKLGKEREQIAQLREKLEASQEQIDEQVKARVAKEREKIESDARVEAQQVVAVELKDREEQAAEVARKLKLSQEKELKLLKEKRDLEEKAEQNELEVVRRLEEERKKIRSTAMEQANEEHQLKLAEKDHAIESMKKKIDELKQKAEQGSQQIQGEVQELALEAMLPAEFPGDVIKPVAKGVKGADVLQQVYDATGRECGSILWESKRTKNWSDGWLTKLMDDQQEAKASYACIVTSALPKDVQHFEERNGVWVASWTCVRSVALALRHALIETARAQRTTVGQEGKRELVYNYISSGEFILRFKGIVKPYLDMLADLESEKTAFQRVWNKRQKQLDRAISSATGLFGDLQGLMGNGLQEIEGMDALAIEAEVDDDQVLQPRDTISIQESTD